MLIYCHDMYEFWFTIICIDMNVILDISTTIEQLYRQFWLPVNGSTQRIFFIEIQQWGLILVLMCLCWGKMWKSNVKNIFSYPMLACQQVGVKSNHMVLLGVSWSHNNLNQLAMSAHSRQLERQNIIDRMHTWPQCSVITSEDILTTKYGFNLR